MSRLNNLFGRKIPPEVQKPVEMLPSREEILAQLNRKFKQELKVVLENEEGKKLLFKLRTFSEESFDFGDGTNFMEINRVEKFMEDIFSDLEKINILQGLRGLFHSSLTEEEEALLGKEEFISHDQIDCIGEKLRPSSIVYPTSYSNNLEWEERYNNNKVNSKFNYQKISNIQKIFSLLFEKIGFVTQ